MSLFDVNVDIDKTLITPKLRITWNHKHAIKANLFIDLPPRNELSDALTQTSEIHQNFNNRFFDELLN